MKLASIRPFLVALILGVLALGATAPALAQQKAALVQDRDQVGRDYYYAEGACSQATSQYCSVVFQTPPAGKRLMITRVNTLNLMTAPTSITSMDLRYQGGSVIAFLIPVVNPGIFGTTNYTSNDAILAKFDPGEIPQVLTFVTDTANFQMVAIITGYMIDIP